MRVRGFGGFNSALEVGVIGAGLLQLRPGERLGPGQPLIGSSQGVGSRARRRFLGIASRGAAQFLGEAFDRTREVRVAEVRLKGAETRVELRAKRVEVAAPRGQQRGPRGLDRRFGPTLCNDVNGHVRLLMHLTQPPTA